MDFLLSDEMLATLVPILVYWVYSGLYMALGHFKENYRIHSDDDEKKNLVSKQEVIKGVILQQAVQASFAALAFMITRDGNQPNSRPQPSLPVQARQFLAAMVVFDTWQYFMHRYMHQNKYMYRRFHSWHHRLAAPYAFAAQYSHPIDGLLIETFSGALAYLVSGMTPRTSIFFFCFATIKGIDDHCGLMIPGNVFHLLFRNNTAYHDVHHQRAGGKCNFSQPFFVTWDMVLGTYLSYEVEKRKDGGFRVRPLKHLVSDQ